MTIKVKNKSDIVQHINAYANNSIRNGKLETDYDKEFIYKVLNEFEKIPNIMSIYDEDILIDSINNEITKHYTYGSFALQNKEVELFVNNIYDSLLTRIADHTIVIPIPFAQFGKLIRLNNLMFIPEGYSRKRKIKIIAQNTSKSLNDTESIINHTENSRSENFLKFPLLCIKQKNQTSSIHYHSLNVAKILIYSIRCYYYAMLFNTNQDKTNIFKNKLRSYSEATHLAIYSSEKWRENHKPLNFDSSIKFDISFLNHRKIQKQFSEFINSLYMERIDDEFNLKYINALLLFNESLQVNYDISVILMTTIAESLTAKGKNEKRLRISAIIPRLINLKKNEFRNVSIKLNELYHLRNSFLHDGASVTVRNITHRQNVDIIQECRKIIAKLIIMYPNHEKIIHQENYQNNNRQNGRVKQWENYVDSIFKKLIF